MTHIIEYVETTKAGAKAYKGMPEHQALVYSAESLVSQALPLPLLTFDESRAFIEYICDIEDIDSPRVERPEYLNKRFIACASKSKYLIALNGKVSTLTLCHELAHCLTDNGHGEEWRTKFIHLARTHVSIEHGALLYALYTRLNLPAKWN
jgi:hypothetical protein